MLITYQYSNTLVLSDNTNVIISARNMAIR